MLSSTWSSFDTSLKLRFRTRIGLGIFKSTSSFFCSAADTLNANALADGYSERFILAIAQIAIVMKLILVWCQVLCPANISD
jgi:hypothetical protein